MIRWVWSKVMKWGWDFNHDLRSNSIELAEATPKRGRGRLGNGLSTRRVEHNYDDETVITFKVYGANGGKIVETSRYDDKKDNESIRRYVIDENADLAESLGKIVTVEYMR